MRIQLCRGAMIGFFLLTGVHIRALNEVDGYYRTGSAQDMAEFEKIVNDGKPQVNAVLTADIDLSGVEMPCIYSRNLRLDSTCSILGKDNVAMVGLPRGFYILKGDKGAARAMVKYSI